MKIVYSGTASKMFGTTKETHCTCLTKKAILSIIMFMAISFFLSKSVLALELSLISPNNIEINNEFQTEINLDSEEIYDVKIFVHDSQDSGVTRDEYISQIFNTQKDIWQSSWNYLSGSYPNERKYRLKVLESPGNR